MAEGKSPTGGFHACRLRSLQLDANNSEPPCGTDRPGTVILFDEYFNFPNWERHEFKAFQEFVEKYGIKYSLSRLRAATGCGARRSIRRRARMNSAREFAAEVVMTPAAARLHTPESVAAPARESPIELTIFVSCYNEEPYITKTLKTVRAALAEAGRLHCEIIVIDDCSTDRSADLVSRLYRRASRRTDFASPKQTQSGIGAELFRCSLHRQRQILPLDLRR